MSEEKNEVYAMNCGSCDHWMKKSDCPREKQGFKPSCSDWCSAHSKNKTTKSVEQQAEEYAKSCDNESGCFVSRDLINIRAKAFKAGYAAARSDAIREVCVWLKSDDAKHIMKGKAGNLGERGATLMAGSEWAKEIETRFGVEK